MHYVVLMMAWITPAAIAGALGWSGTWGSGSAFADYLIPIPVAGGVFHVPSFALAALTIFALKRSDTPSAGILPAAAFGVLLAALALMVEVDRLSGWLFTDYDPAGAPLRLDGNPFLLFVASDAAWVGVYALMRHFSSPARFWLALPFVPVFIVGYGIFSYHTSGPIFEMGGSTYTTNRGEQIVAVYTAEPFDETVFKAWTTKDPNFLLPWQDVNSEHVAVYFTRSLQMTKWGRFDALDSADTVGTICLYEEDRSVVAHRGYFDCFAQRMTVAEEVRLLSERGETGLGKELDAWFARVQICDDVEFVDVRSQDIARVGFCQGVANTYVRDIKRIARKFGADSEQARFVKAQAASRPWLQS